MPTQMFHPAAEKVLDDVDPALLDALRRVEEGMEGVRSGHGVAYAAMWAAADEDPDIMYPQPGAPTIYGDEIRETFRTYDRPGSEPVDLVTEYQRIVQVGDLAFVVLIERAPVRYADAPLDAELAGNVTYILRRFGDQWKLIHRHVHGMNKFSLHTYDSYTCPECGVTLFDTPFRNHCIAEHGMTYPDVYAIMAKQNADAGSGG